MPLPADLSQGDVAELSLTNGDRDVVGVIETDAQAIDGYLIALEPVNDRDDDPVFVPNDDLHLRLSAKRVTFRIDEVVKVRHFGGLSGFASYDLSPHLPQAVEDAVKDIIDGNAGGNGGSA